MELQLRSPSRGDSGRLYPVHFPEAGGVMIEERGCEEQLLSSPMTCLFLAAQANM